MSHTVHPYAHRIGILRDWKSRWFSTDKQYRDFLRTDLKLREYLEKRLRGMYIGALEIERNQKAFRIIIKTSRPGMIIGRNGEGVTKLRADLASFMAKHKLVGGKDFKLDIEE